MRNLYRRWRPLKLDDVIGQEQVTEPLGNAIKQGKINHAYLFVGPRGTGKTTVARIFAHMINGFNYELEDDYVDIVEIDGASNRGVDNIREIREKAMIAPTVGKYKVYIIDEVHMLTKEAFNALLKTLEEPPEHVVFIMATTDADKVPVTITSRSQTYTFKLADFDVILKHLRKISEQEKIKIDDAALEIVAKKGGGSFRDSLSLLDQISTISDAEITREMVEKIMGLPNAEKLRTLLDAYTSQDVVKITTLMKDFLSTGVKAETLAEELIGEIIEKPDDKTIGLLAKLVDVKAPFAEARLLISLAPAPSPSGQTARVGMSYAGQPTEPPLRGEPVGVGRNIHSSSRNLETSTQEKAAGASTNSGDAKMSNLQKFLASRGRGGGNEKNDALNSKISDIMGGEVEEYGGGNPF